MMKPAKILFVSHDASRTGAPILLLNLAHLLVKNDYEVSFLINRAPFDILEQFKPFPFSLATPDAIVHDKWTYLRKKLKHTLGFPAYDHAAIRKAIRTADLIISNTITNGDILPLIRKSFKGPVITYVHELTRASQNFTTPEHLSSVLELSDGFLVPSMAVRDFLVNELKVSSSKVQLLHYFIPAGQQKVIARSNNPLFTVGASGTLDWRKAPDLFVSVAKLVLEKNPGAEIKFVWKGAYESDALTSLQRDVTTFGLHGKVEFRPADARMKEFYADLDLFVLSSREDPYPLVVLEAAASEVPVICFSAAGGAPEFVTASRGGKVVSHLDVDAMAEAVIHYYTSRHETRRDGQLASEYLTKTHMDPHYVMGQFQSILHSYTTKK